MLCSCKKDGVRLGFGRSRLLWLMLADDAVERTNESRVLGIFAEDNPRGRVRERFAGYTMTFVAYLCIGIFSIILVRSWGNISLTEILNL